MGSEMCIRDRLDFVPEITIFYNRVVGGRSSGGGGRGGVDGRSISLEGCMQLTWGFFLCIEEDN